MSKSLVVYFSISGRTAAVARQLADIVGADVYELTPVEPYTKEDLNYREKHSRVNIEMNDERARPVLAGELPQVDDYDVVYVGYPIWWGRHPHVIDTFVEAENFGGKPLVPFATSGGSGFEYAQKHIDAAATTAHVLKGRNLTSATEANIKDWLRELGLYQAE